MRFLPVRSVLPAFQIVLPFDITWPAMRFAIRTTAASLIALYVAFLMDLDDPKWAAMTVWIVAQGNRGMSVSKGKYRFAGTFVGASVGIFLMAVFPHAPGLALPLLALWLGLCTALSTGLRNFRSYGAVLAGYTAVIVVMDSVSNPHDVFNIAIARVSYIGLGIVVEATMAMLFATDDPVDDVRGKLRAFLQQSSSLSALALRGTSTHHALHKVFGGALAVDSAAEYAAAVSARMRRRLGHLRGAVIGSLLQISAARALRAQFVRMPAGDSDIVARAADLLDQAAAAPGEALLAIAALNDRLDLLLQAEAAHADGSMSEYALSLHRLRNLMRGLQGALQSEQSLGQTDAHASRVRFSSHVDHKAALINGLRAGAALLAASAVWVATAWSVGSAFVTIVGVVAALFGTRPNPVAGGIGFLKGAAIAVVVAAVCNFAILPALSGFVPLAIVLSVLLIPAGLLFGNPRFALPATGYAIFFLDLVGPSNVSRADPEIFFNGSIALLLGIAIGALVFKLILPVNVPAIQRRLVRAVRDDLAAIGRDADGWSIEAWVSRTADRIERRLISGGAQAEDDMQAMLTMMSVGCAAIELDHLLKGEGVPRKPVDAVMRALGAMDPERVVRTARHAGNRLLRRAAHEDAVNARRSLAAASLLRDIEQTVISCADAMRSGAKPVGRTGRAQVEPMPEAVAA